MGDPVEHPCSPIPCRFQVSLPGCRMVTALNGRCSQRGRGLLEDSEPLKSRPWAFQLEFHPLHCPVCGSRPLQVFNCLRMTPEFRGKDRINWERLSGRSIHLSQADRVDRFPREKWEGWFSSVGTCTGKNVATGKLMSHVGTCLASPVRSAGSDDAGLWSRNLEFRARDAALSL